MPVAFPYAHLCPTIYIYLFLKFYISNLYTHLTLHADVEYNEYLTILKYKVINEHKLLLIINGPINFQFRIYNLIYLNYKP